MPSGNSFPSSTFSYGLGNHIITGNVVFVDSGATNAVADTEGLKRKPFNTIENALNNGNLVANNGDVVVVMPGHSETITTDGGIALDIAGVSIIGLGRGTSRPTITLDTAAAAAITVTADNCMMRNIVIESSFADVTNAIDVTAAWFHADELEFTEGAVNENFLDYIVASSTTDNNADGLTITNCVGTSVDAGMNSPVRIVADVDRLVMQNCIWNTDHANALAMIQVATGKDLTDCRVEGNRYASLKASGDILIDNDTTANSGWVANNFAIHADVAGEILVDCDGVGLFENYATAVVTASGYLLPAADS